MWALYREIVVLQRKSNLCAHVTMSVIIVLAALPLVFVAFGNVGSAPILATRSRGLLGLIGLWK